MNTLLTLGLIICGLYTASCIWIINLKIERYEFLARRSSLIGLIIILVMFIYSIYFIKGVDYSFGVILGLSIGITIVWLLACGFAIGIFTIMTVGTYWLITTWKKTDFHELWSNIKLDFKAKITSLKSWIDDEE